MRPAMHHGQFDLLVDSSFSSTMARSTGVLNRLIRVICHSSAEAETAAATLMAKRLTFIRQLCADFKFDVKCPIVVFLDNTAAIDLCQKLGTSARSAHFLRWVFYFRKCVLDKIMAPIFCPTNILVADPMTEQVDKKHYTHFLRELNHCHE